MVDSFPKYIELFNVWYNVKRKLSNKRSTWVDSV